MSGDKRELWARIRAEHIDLDDILLEPCYDGDCDGPWHESKVEAVKTDHTNTYATTLLDSGVVEIWCLFREDMVTILDRGRRYVRTSSQLIS